MILETRNQGSGRGERKRGHVGGEGKVAGE